MPDWPTKQDPNQFPAIFGISGTAGTSSLGTAESVPIGVNPTTGALYVEDLGCGGTAGTIVQVETGTLSNVGTVVGVGTLSNIGSVAKIGALEIGTVKVELTTSRLGGASTNTA